MLYAGTIAHSGVKWREVVCTYTAAEHCVPGLCRLTAVVIHHRYGPPWHVGSAVAIGYCLCTRH